MEVTPHSADVGPGTWLWMSFADAHKPKGQQFLGVLLIKAENILEAAKQAHARGLNPGGEVLATPLPSPMSPQMYATIAPYLGRLLNAAECAELDGKLRLLVN